MSGSGGSANRGAVASDVTLSVGDQTPQGLDGPMQPGLLRRYLIYNDIPLHLSQRIIRFLQHGYRIRNEALSAGNHLPILDLLSQSLQGELQFERYRGCLNELKFIEQLPAESRQTVQVMHKLAMRAIINTVVGNDDVIFCAADWATSAYCAQSGRLHYHGDEEGEPVTTIQGCNSWIAEMSLWTPWSHMGDLVSEEVSRIVVMNVEQFCKCVRESSECQAAAVAYAKDYVDQLRKCNQLNDLFVLTKMQHNLSRQASIQSAAPHKRCCRFLSWNNEVHPAD
ncbi:unnamed protein product [Durusdinium trenchii]|uniref:Uncharacterized protein n=3 Tax=Durusdinium trenchii TaxID=1381693 RepID=A0ABP0LMZ5_9DINO